jgi:single-strand DNA-binding protein
MRGQEEEKMAGSVNKAVLIGRLGSDPEMRQTQSNTSVCNFTLATNENWRDKSGQNQESTEWHKIVVWGRQGEIANQYLSKGRLVYIEGRIQTRKYQDRDGNDRYSTEIVARDIQFLSSQGDNASQGTSQMGSQPSAQMGSQPSGFAPQSAPSGPSAPPADDFTEDDIPF